jgi:uncharacterized membrane protein HdeD (DUF308 family)
MGNGILWIIIGIISVVGGIIALANPVIASLTATQIAGYIFIFVGIIQIVGAFGQDGIGSKLWNILLGVLAVWLGISILGHPLAGMLALTTMVAILFFISGVVKVALAFSVEDRSPYWLILISGVVSVLLAIMIFSNFPESAGITLGILLGVDLISNGAWLISLGAAIRKSDPA